MPLEELQDVPIGSDRKPARLFMVPLETTTGERLDDYPPIRLQWWPETIEYDRGEIGWQAQKIPGLSHPLYQWTANGGPTVSFEVVLTAENDPAYSTSGGKVEEVSLEPNGGEAKATPYSVDVNAGLAWLEALAEPKPAKRTGQTGSAEPVEPPPTVQVIPEFRAPPSQAGALSDASQQRKANNSTVGGILGLDSVEARVGEQRGIHLSHQAGRDFYGLLNDFSITYEKHFPSGRPRLARVSLSFFETIQLGDVVMPHDRRKTLEIAREFELVSDG